MITEITTFRKTDNKGLIESFIPRHLRQYIFALILALYYLFHASTIQTPSDEKYFVNFKCMLNFIFRIIFFDLHELLKKIYGSFIKIRLPQKMK